MRLVMMVVIAWTAVGHLVAQRASSPEPMSTKAIEEAIGVGQKKAPTPYLLRHSAGRGGLETNNVVLGRVYTPFLRVALASHRAALDGRQLSASDIEPALTEPLLYVAIRRETLPPSATDVRVFISRQGDYLWQIGIDPLWVRDARVALGSFEEETDVADFALVAAFPLENVKPGLHVLVTKKLPGLDGTFLAQSPISQKVLDEWR